MQTSEMFFKALIENTSLALILVQGNGRISYMSPFIEKMLEWEKKDWEHMNIEELLHADDIPELQELYRELTLNNARVITRILKLRHENGTWRMFRVFAENMCDQHDIRGFVFNCHEITESLDLKEKFLQSQKMEAIGNLAGGISHDFSNLLVAIQGYSELALLKMGSNDPLIHELKGIHDAALSAGELTRQLLILSQKRAVKASIVNINKIINGMMKMFMRIIGENIVIETVLGPGLWKVKGDKANFEQLLLNLVVNAKDAMPFGGTLTIKTENMEPHEESTDGREERRKEKMLCLRVSDTGIGMEKETLRNIFEPFFTTKGSEKGTGLGLSIVHGIVMRHDGYIEVHSQPGKGSCFSIYLPVTVQEHEEEPEKVDRSESTLSSLRGKGEKILIVEDDRSARNYLKKVLEQYRYTVSTAASAKEAIEVFQDDAPCDLLFCDVVLPDLSGLILAEGLRTRVPSLKILMTSGYSEEKSQLNTIIEKNIPFIHKPYPLLVLLQAIRRVIDRNGN